MFTSSVSDPEWLDAWIGSLLSVQEIESSEVLLINPDILMDSGTMWNYASRLREHMIHVTEKGENDHDIPPIGLMDREVLEIYNQIGFCWDTAFRHTANKVSASDSCYGVGSQSQY